MKKGIYLFLGMNELVANQYPGVQKKINMQCEAFSKYYEMEYIPLYDLKDGVIYKALKRFPFVSTERDYHSIINIINNVTFIYIRRDTADRRLIGFLKKIKSINPDCKIIIEIYTYPYDRDEYRRIARKPFLLKDYIYRKKYKGIVDRIVTFSEDKTIFGVDTIRIMNGINVSVNRAIRNKPEAYRKSINLIFVGTMQVQHGLERIIMGLKRYYQSNSKIVVKCLLVGDGPELNHYKSLVLQYKLGEQVVFCGKRIGAELDDIYDCADIAIAPFGLYKTLGENSVSSALKTREYLAKGLPVITGCREDVYERFPCDFFKIFSNDSSVVDIKEVVNWYTDLLDHHIDRIKLANSIREYAYEYVDISSTMKPIINYLENNNLP